MNTKLVDYTSFTGMMAAHHVGKREGDSLETDEEFLRIVAIVYRDAVSAYMKDSKLYTKKLPIDIYEGVKDYDIPSPDGFVVQRVVRLLENKIKIPSHSYTTEQLHLSCCPVRDVKGAFYVEVAVSPKRLSGTCEFEEDFIERNYEVIKLRMLMEMAQMTARTWKAKVSAEEYRRQYRKMVQQNITDTLTGGSRIRVKDTRFTDVTLC